jgi:predicted amidohydrolase
MSEQPKTLRLALAQLALTDQVEENLRRTLTAMEEAKERGAEMIFFPEVQLSPFFPQYEKRDASRWLLSLDSPEVLAIREKCRELGIYASPNVYLEENGKRYDASLMIDDAGQVLGISKMVHIAQAQFFYEQDYYTPSSEGFRVYDTPWGKVGIVICFDRHLPDGVRSCALQGAELVLIPTANIQGEPLELFQWEVQVQAYQSGVFVAMCNRVGQEGELTFAGESLVAGPDGSLLHKTGGDPTLSVVEIPLEQVREQRSRRPWTVWETK